MANAANQETKTYEIGYKGFCYEFSESYTCIVIAKTERQALRQFARQRHVKLPTASDVDNWKWEDGDWLMAFRYIKEVSVKKCPHCQGSGIVAAATTS